jgi:mRNA-degrading endonuclease HigB of HigAB toxin-antitoxin module
LHCSSFILSVQDKNLTESFCIQTKAIVKSQFFEAKCAYFAFVVHQTTFVKTKCPKSLGKNYRNFNCFNSLDKLDDLYVFDIGGNKPRLNAGIYLGLEPKSNG